MKAKKIIHVDMDAFYASVETLDKPHFRNKPIAIGGSPEERGVISTANYEARKFGVKSAISSHKAFKLCPNLILLPPDFKKYKKMSLAIHEIFSRFTNLIEPLSLDEAYLDVSKCKQFHGSATLIAKEIKRLILHELGLTASAGIAPNKFLAKVASDWKKPNGLYLITPEEISDFVKELPVEKIPGVGKVSKNKFHKLGITTCKDLQKYTKLELINLCGNWGKSLYELSRGIDNRNVITEWERKSFSVERTFSTDLPNLEACQKKLPLIYQELISRFKKSEHKYIIKGLMIKLKFNNFTSTTVESSNYKIKKIEYFLELLEKAYYRKNLPVRLIGAGFKIRDPNFIQTSTQLELNL